MWSNVCEENDGTFIYIYGVFEGTEREAKRDNSNNLMMVVIMVKIIVIGTIIIVVKRQ